MLYGTGWTASASGLVPEFFSDTKLLQQVAQRRPADRGYRIASVWQSNKGHWLRPDACIVTVHGVSPMQDGPAGVFEQNRAVLNSELA